MRKYENVKMRKWENEKMWKCENVKICKKQMYNDETVIRLNGNRPNNQC